MCQCTGGYTGRGKGDGREKIQPFLFGMYNIRNGQNGGLESALRGMLKENFDPGIFQETKVTWGNFVRKSSRY